MKERASYGKDKMISCSERLYALACAKKALQYHKERYKDSTNKTNLKRSKQPYENMLALGNLPNVTNNQVVQKDKCSGKTPLKKKP